MNGRIANKMQTLTLNRILIELVGSVGTNRIFIEFYLKINRTFPYRELLLLLGETFTSTSQSSTKKEKIDTE